MQFKDTVILDISRNMAKALPAIEQAHLDAGITRGAVITAAKDGKHMKGSLHHAGLGDKEPSDALDLRTKDLNLEQGSLLAERLRVRLNGDRKAQLPFQVVVEVHEGTPHIHVEYDPS